MSGKALLVTSPGAAAYDLGEGHPMRAVRAELTTRLAGALGVLARPSWSVEQAPAARTEELALVHTEAYIGLVQGAEFLPPAFLAYAGPLHWRLVGFLTGAVALGSLVGGRVSARVPSARLTVVFVGVLVCVAGYIAARPLLAG